MYGSTQLQLNTWYHVAITYDTARFQLCVNGQLENSMALTGPLVTTTGPLKLGGYGISPYALPGRVDEASVYNRALSSAEIQSIYQAGSAGKCSSPSITLQPQGQVGYWGASATFNVHANGSAPLAYLWYKDGFPITWATNSSLVLTNLSLDLDHVSRSDAAL